MGVDQSRQQCHTRQLDHASVGRSLHLVNRPSAHNALTAYEHDPTVVSFIRQAIEDSGRLEQDRPSVLAVSDAPRNAKKNKSGQKLSMHGVLRLDAQGMAQPSCWGNANRSAGPKASV